MSADKIMVGLLLPYTEKKITELQQKKEPVLLGVSLENLFKYINYLEVQHKNNRDLVIANLKENLMYATGLLLDEEQQNEVDTNVSK
jgi:activator of 2-hydroxyglutaryl-CoA dehydratase